MPAWALGRGVEREEEEGSRSGVWVACVSLIVVGLSGPCKVAAEARRKTEFSFAGLLVTAPAERRGNCTGIGVRTNARGTGRGDKKKERGRKENCKIHGTDVP